MRPHRGDLVGVSLGGDDGDRGVGDAEAVGLLGEAGGGDGAGFAHAQVVVVDQGAGFEQAVQGGEDQDAGAGALCEGGTGEGGTAGVRAGVLRVGADQAGGFACAAGDDHDRGGGAGGRGCRGGGGALGRAVRGQLGEAGVESGGQVPAPGGAGGAGGAEQGGVQGFGVQSRGQRAGGAVGVGPGGRALVVTVLLGGPVLMVGFDVRGVDLGLLGGVAARGGGGSGCVPEFGGVAEAVDDRAGGLVGDDDGAARAFDGDQGAVAGGGLAAAEPVALGGVSGVAVVGSDRGCGVRHGGAFLSDLRGVRPRGASTPYPYHASVITTTGPRSGVVYPGTGTGPARLRGPRSRCAGQRESGSGWQVCPVRRRLPGVHDSGCSARRRGAGRRTVPGSRGHRWPCAGR